MRAVWLSARLRATDRKVHRGRRLVVWRLEDGNDVVRANGPIELDQFPAQTLEEFGGPIGASGAVFQFLNSLVGPVDQRDVGGHTLLPSIDGKDRNQRSRVSCRSLP
jgi:hypothetical protein